MSNTSNSQAELRGGGAFGERLGYVLAAGFAALAGWTGYALFQSTATPFMVWTFFGSLSVLALLLALAMMHTRNAKYICIGLGVPVLALASWLHNWRSEQVELYNQAMIAWDKHDLKECQRLLQESSKAYQNESHRSQLANLFLPQARRDLEARNHNLQGVIFVQQRKAKEAVQEFFTSLQYNSGNRYIGLLSDIAARWENDARKPKANLEKLYRMGQANGNAKGKQGQQPGQPQPGQDRDPGKDPNNSHGRQPPGKL